MAEKKEYLRNLSAKKKEPEMARQSEMILAQSKPLSSEMILA